MDFDAGMHHRRELSPGQMLGHYRIESWLGEGAMGVVYRAVDTHLDRPVAIKVLRPESVAHPERRRRFIQEAKAASALNHPNIITIYDISSADGVDYIAMEYVDGKTLGALIGRRGLPWSEAVKYGMQVADALAAAHAAGLVHRDLKPANVMATPQGLVKVLDFGLAKLIEATEAVSHTARDEDEHTPTETVRVAPAPHTEDGVIVGTVAYMSPEQAQGRPLDGRSDIFAFGSLFYEMLTGRWAFNGDNRLAILAAILNQEPAALGVEVPPELERVLHRCLRKDPERRFQAMGDVRVALQELKEESESGRLAQAPASAWVPTRRRLWTAAALAAVVLAAAGSWWLRERARDKPPAGEKLIAVLPFRNVGGDPAHQAFCDGLSETVTSRLTQLERFQNALRVVSSSEVRREKVASARDARQALGAALVVDGSLHRSGEGAVVTASLVDTRRGVQLRSQSIRVRVEELPRLQDLLIEAITGMLEREAGFHAKLPSGVPGATSAPGAYDYYVQGRGYLQDPDRAPNVESALALFRRALEIDPGYALALAGLGEAYWHKYRVTNDPRWINEAVQACAAAIRLNEELAPTHVTLGVVYRAAPDGTRRPSASCSGLSSSIR
jgi:TolB-like protein/tRNA A-37 threonylcarbamoyl transferase component Bud32